MIETYKDNDLAIYKTICIVFFLLAVSYIFIFISITSLTHWHWQRRQNVLNKTKYEMRQYGQMK